jgi:hypothetical protein
MTKIKSAEATRVKRGLLLCAASLAALSAVGCAQDAGLDEASAQDGDAVEPAALQASGGSKQVRDPGGSYFADITANGTGCPAGTWDTQLSADGQTFTTTFSAFEAEVDPRRAVSIKNCQLAIKLHSPQGLSYSVQEFYYGGYAFLEDGVNARVISNYYFQGNPADNQQPETTFVGPKDDTYLIQDTRNQIEAKPVWSPCGVDRNLNVNTTLRLLNSNPRKNGYVNVSAVDGSTKLVLKLSWRRCSE